MVLTHSQDIGRFVAEMLDLPRWEKRIFLIGDRHLPNEFLRIAEKAKKVGFEKHYERVETLNRGRVLCLRRGCPFFLLGWI
jgi:hypothetical protein